MSGWGGALAGAGTGAEIGSFFGPIGTGVGAGVGALGGWLLGHHADKKKDDANPEDPYQALLKSSSESNRAEGNNLLGMGQAGIGPAMEYFQRLLSSNPADVADATRADRGRVLDQYDTARRSIATFGPRGGGVTSALAGSQFQQAESLADVTSNAQRGAASASGALGTATAGLGLQANQLASADINTIINSILAREGLDVQKHGQNMALLGDIGQAAGTLIGLGMGGGGGA